MANADELLRKTSRTFGLAIPLLPEPTRTEVKIAYLLFRIVNTFEDAVHLGPIRRSNAIQDFLELMDRPPADEAASMAEECVRHPPVDNEDYVELLGEIPLVLEELHLLDPAARQHVSAHVARSAEGMKASISRTNGAGVLQLHTLQDLRDYCYVVAGIVGEMLTELYLLKRPQLQPIAAELRPRASRFGEGLQLVNILKDADPDASEGRIFLPKGVPIEEVFALAHADLEVAAQYTDLLRTAGAPHGLVAFNALIMRLAVGTLTALRRDGLGAKLTRLEVASIIAQVAHGLDTGQPLSAQL